MPLMKKYTLMKGDKTMNTDKMRITAIQHYDDILGNGYYLVSETMDRTWYKGDTPEEAVQHYIEQYSIPVTLNDVVIYERV